MPAGLSASVYTEITDVESELNGLCTYDRQVVKVDEARVRAANLALDQRLEAARRHRSRCPPARTVAAGHHPRLHRPLPAPPGRRSPTPRSSTRQQRPAEERRHLEVVPGLADSGCYSFESRNYPGQYLRHRDFRVHREAGDGSALFRADATFCAVAGQGESGWPHNYPGSICGTTTPRCSWRLRAAHRRQPDDFAEDTTWAVEAPWAP